MLQLMYSPCLAEKEKSLGLSPIDIYSVFAYLELPTEEFFCAQDRSFPLVGGGAVLFKLYYLIVNVIFSNPLFPFSLWKPAIIRLLFEKLPEFFHER